MSLRHLSLRIGKVIILYDKKYTYFSIDNNDYPVCFVFECLRVRCLELQLSPHALYEVLGKHDNSAARRLDAAQNLVLDVLSRDPVSVVQTHSIFGVTGLEAWN